MNVMKKESVERMDQKKILKGMIDFNNAAFNNSFNTMATMQEQMEKVTKTLMTQATWLPEEGRKALMDWIGAYKEGRERFKASVDESFKAVEAFFKTES